MSQVNNYSVNLGLTSYPETKNPELSFELQKVYNAITNLALALDSYTGAQSPDSGIWSAIGIADYLLATNTHKIFIQAGEAISYGQAVAIYPANGKALRAITDNTDRVMRGFKNNAGTCAVNDYIEVCLEGVVVTSGLTAGNTYWLSSTVLGNYSAVSTGVKPQVAGFALSSTLLYVNPAIQ